MVSIGDMMIFQCDVALRSRSLKEPDWEYKRHTKSKGSICIVVGTQSYGDDKVDCCIIEHHPIQGMHIGWCRSNLLENI